MAPFDFTEWRHLCTVRAARVIVFGYSLPERPTTAASITCRLRWGLPWLLALALLASVAPALPTRIALAAESVALPFPGGNAVRIIQGYNGGTHQGRSRFGLDLVLADGGTSGAEVVSPVDGTVTYANAPRSGTGCIAIAFRDGSHTVMLCHVALDRAYGRGESVARGQSLGTVGEPGTVGNNGVSHVHLELHSGNSVSSPVPFAGPNGLPLDGVELPESSTTAVVSRREPIVSSNRAGTERTQLLANKPEPAPVTAASVPSTTRAVPPTAAPTAAAATRLAVVQGTDSCLKVHTQPSSDATTVGCLRDGTEVTLKPLAAGADASWRQTDQGWVSGAFLKRTQAVVGGTGDCLNVRDAPRPGAARLSCLPDGTAVTIVEGPKVADGSTWYRIEPAGPAKQGGWVAGKYLD